MTRVETAAGPNSEPDPALRPTGGEPLPSRRGSSRLRRAAERRDPERDERG